MTKQYLIPILAAAALMTVPLLLDQDADARNHQNYPNPAEYEDLEAFSTGQPERSAPCFRQQEPTVQTDLPDITIRSPLVSESGFCRHLEPLDYIAVMYRIGDGSQPHEQLFKETYEKTPITLELNLDDDEYGFGEYKFFFFATDGTTNYWVAGAGVTHAVATATMTIAPPPPVITNPPDGTQFLVGNETQRINGTSLHNVVVFLNVTQINADGTRGDTIQRQIGNNVDSPPDWFFDVDLYKGENRLTAWAEKNDVPSGTDEITLYVVNERLDAPVITSPENNARFANTDRTQTVRGTSDGDTVTLKLLEYDDGQLVNNMTHAGIVVGPEGTWSQEVELFESATIRLVATSHVGRITSPESEHVVVRTTADAACSTGISAALDFGILTVGDTSKDGTLSFENTGTQASRHKVHGTDWVNPEQTTQVVMDVGQTKHHTTENTAYAAKRTLTGTMADAVTGLAAGATEDLYLQVRVELDRPSFAGDIQQKITVSSSCD